MGEKVLLETAAELVCSGLPPVRPEYHLNVPVDALDAVNVTLPVPQRVPPVTVGATAAGLTTRFKLPVMSCAQVVVAFVANIV